MITGDLRMDAPTLRQPGTSAPAHDDESVGDPPALGAEGQPSDMPSHPKVVYPPIAAALTGGIASHDGPPQAFDLGSLRDDCRLRSRHGHVVGGDKELPARPWSPASLRDDRVLRACRVLALVAVVDADENAGNANRREALSALTASMSRTEEHPAQESAQRRELLHDVGGRFAYYDSLAQQRILEMRVGRKDFGDDILTMQSPLATVDQCNTRTLDVTVNREESLREEVVCLRELSDLARFHMDDLAATIQMRLQVELADTRTALSERIEVLENIMLREDGASADDNQDRYTGRRRSKHDNIPEERIRLTGSGEDAAS